MYKVRLRRQTSGLRDNRLSGRRVAGDLNVVRVMWGDTNGERELGH